MQSGPNPCFPRPQIPRHQTSTPTFPPLLLHQLPAQSFRSSTYRAVQFVKLQDYTPSLPHALPERSSAGRFYSALFWSKRRKAKKNPIKHDSYNTSAPKAERSLPCSFTEKCPKRRQRQHWRSTLRLSSVQTSAQDIIAKLSRPQLQQREVYLSENKKSSSAIRPNRLYPPFPLSHTQWPMKSSSASSSENGNTYGPKRSSTSGSSS